MSLVPVVKNSSATPVPSLVALFERVTVVPLMAQVVFGGIPGPTTVCPFTMPVPEVTVTVGLPLAVSPVVDAA